MSYIPKKKRVKIIPWCIDFAETESVVNQACSDIEERGGSILSIKIFDEQKETIPACAIVYEL